MIDFLLVDPEQGCRLGCPIVDVDLGWNHLAILSILKLGTKRIHCDNKHDWNDYTLIRIE